PPQRPKSQWGYSGYSARIDSLQRLLQRSARCTYSSYSTRLISAQGSRHIDRRAVLIAVIALDQSSQRSLHQIVRLIYNVKVFLQITYLPKIMPNTKKITFAKLSGGDNYTY
ncbi:hypothetical protein L249_2530, partial [Ophiocordyceps polyrhachis-furcata BCC 54312]